MYSLINSLSSRISIEERINFIKMTGVTGTALGVAASGIKIFYELTIANFIKYKYKQDDLFSYQKAPNLMLQYTATGTAIGLGAGYSLAFPILATTMYSSFGFLKYKEIKNKLNIIMLQQIQENNLKRSKAKESASVTCD